MQEQNIEGGKTKSNKGWMISTIVLVMILIGLGVFGGMIIVKGNRDTNELANVRTELEEKNKKIAELEKEASADKEIAKDDKTKEDATSSAIDIDYDGLKKLAEKDGETLRVYRIEVTTDQKYVFAMGNLSPKTGMGGAHGVWYRSTAADSSWNKFTVAQNVASCESFTDKQIKMMEEYHYVDDGLEGQLLSCYKGSKVYPEEK